MTETDNPIMEEMTESEKYMTEALLEAEKALAAGEVPIGAVMVRNGEIIARGHNLRNTDKNPLRHAEIDVIDVNCATDQNGVYSFTVTNHSEVTVGYSVTVQFKNNMPQNLLQVALDSGAYGDLDANKAISFPVNENLDPLGDSATHEIRFQVIPEEFFGSAQGEESVELALDFTVTVHVQQID